MELFSESSPADIALAADGIAEVLYPEAARMKIKSGWGFGFKVWVRTSDDNAILVLVQALRGVGGWLDIGLARTLPDARGPLGTIEWVRAFDMTGDKRFLASVIGPKLAAVCWAADAAAEKQTNK